MEFNTISMIGLGYIGLPTAAVIASRRKTVIGVDVNPKAVETINKGEIHIVEPELDIVVHSAVKQGYLRATTTPEPADAFLIAVPTPFKVENGNDHAPDLAYIEAASKAIAPVLAKGNLVILESTSPVGTTEKVAKWLAEARPDLTFPQTHGEDSDIRVAHCPERVLPGHVVRELVENDRVIGGMTPKCSEVAKSLYKIFVEGDCLTTTARTAEMAKLTENSFRDVNIAFANELSIICDKLDINVWELIQLANLHPRVNILQPGPGVGGHCIAVDPWFIVSQAPEQSRLIRTARDVNDSKPRWVVEKISELVDELRTVEGKDQDNIRIGCLGLSFKANIEDVRESPALAITQEVSKLFPGQVLAVEPHLDEAPSSLQKLGVPLVDFATAMNADILVLLVDHKLFAEQPFHARADQRVLDTRGMLR